jgi:ubiquinone/menaquinone biosynthesis C-methylase UbiE
MMNIQPIFDSAGKSYQQTRITHWDAIARKRDSWRGMGHWYHRRMQEIYRFHVSPNQHILEVGCADGHLLAALIPTRGIGVDFSEEMIRRAKEFHPELEFIHADAHDLSDIKETLTSSFYRTWLTTSGMCSGSSSSLGRSVHLIRASF